MSPTRKITVRMPTELADWLEGQAASQHRSVSGQVVHHTTIMKEDAATRAGQAQRDNSKAELHQAQAKQHDNLCQYRRSGGIMICDCPLGRAK